MLNLLSFKEAIVPAASAGGTCKDGGLGEAEEEAGVAGLEELDELITDGGYHDCCEEASCGCCSCDPLRIIINKNDNNKIEINIINIKVLFP